MSFYEFRGVNLNEGALDRLLNDPRGEVGRYMTRVGRVILDGARRMVGVRSGALKASLYMRHERGTRTQFVTVGSNLRYAKDHHDGVPPHVIAASPGRVLRFNQGGRIVYTRRVNHPGFRGRNYLTVPLRRAVRG